MDCVYGSTHSVKSIASFLLELTCPFLILYPDGVVCKESEGRKHYS